MQLTYSELWAMITSRNACIKDLESTLASSRAKGASLALRHLDEIEKLNKKIAVQDQGLRVMSDTISWITDNRRIF
jgi:hypothetical protein